MIHEFTRQEIIDYCKRRLGLMAAPQLSGLTDNTQLDNIIFSQFEGWYDNMLHTCKIERAPLTEIGGDVSCLFESEGVARILLPDNLIRLVSLRMAGWNFTITDFVSPDTPTALLQRNPLTAGTPSDPVAIYEPGVLTVFGVLSPDEIATQTQMPPIGGIPHPQIESLKAVVFPTNGKYRVDMGILADAEITV